MGTRGRAYGSWRKVFFPRCALMDCDRRWRCGRGGNEQSYSQWTMPEQVGGQMGSTEKVTFAMDAATRRLTTCLAVPSPGLHASYRVTQEFALTHSASEVRVTEMADRRVSREDGSLCRATR